MNQSLKNIRLFDNFQEEITNEGAGYVILPEKKLKEFPDGVYSMTEFKPPTNPKKSPEGMYFAKKGDEIVFYEGPIYIVNGKLEAAGAQVFKG